MNISDFKYCTNNDKDICLHDCRATHITINGNNLSFVFDDGFWIINDHSFNDNKLHKSSLSVMSLSLIEDEYIDSTTVYIFNQKNGETIREKISINSLIEFINSEHANLEFIYVFRETQGFRKYSFECVLWSDKMPFHKECILSVNANELSYYWNKVTKDKVW